MALPKSAQSDVLGRYYTSPNVSQLLVNKITQKSPARVLDLGSGAGSLSLAAADRWHSAELLTVDVDRCAVSRKLVLHDASSNRHRHIQTDALSPRLPELIGAGRGDIHVGICNPPFIAPEWRDGFGDILEDAGLSGCLPRLATADAALLFLAQNLRLLAPKGTLGIIVPDSLVSAAKYRAFRHALLAQYDLQRVIRLPRHSFAHTDAQAHILIIGKGSSTRSAVILDQLSRESELADAVHVSIEAAVDRLDYRYHANLVGANSTDITIDSLCADLRRGSLTTSQRQLFPFHVLHTTDMTPERFGRWCDLRLFGMNRHLDEARRDGLLTAAPGDILIARVGRNLHSKVMGVSHGYPILTDCVFRLRVPKNHREAVLKQLSSTRGTDWFISRAYGVSAKQISKPDILTFPVL